MELFIKGQESFLRLLQFHSLTPINFCWNLYDTQNEKSGTLFVPEFLKWSIDRLGPAEFDTLSHAVN